MLTRLNCRVRLLVGAVVLLCGIAGCTSEPTVSSPGPQADLSAFVTALQTAKTDAASADTTEPGVARQLFDALEQQLRPKKLTIGLGQLAWDGESSAATVPATFHWTLPDAGDWTYTANWTVNRRGTGSAAHWILAWSPTIIHPQLGARQTIVVSTVAATAGALVDRNDQQLVTPQRVYAVQVAPKKVADRQALADTLSSVLKRFDPALAPAAIVTGIQQADPVIGYTVINLRESEFQSVAAQLKALPGLTFPSQIRDLGPTKNFAKALLAQLTPVAMKLGAGTDGWQIVTVDATGAQVAVLANKDPVAGAKTILTIDRATQLAAENSLAGIAEPAVLVAIQPSTGEILAVAQNAAADAQGPIALTGRYPPGSIFKIVTATAAIDTAEATPTTTVGCPGTWTINNRDIHNENGFDLGSVPLSLAFAKSCNTTFARLASTMSRSRLTTTAKQYGIGLDFVIPGVTTLTGSAPPADDATQLAEDGFGQGTVLVSPFSAALMAATADAGNMPVPVLIRGRKTVVDQAVPPRTTAARSGIATLMSAVVEVGTARNLQAVASGSNTVHAKTGTAEYTQAGKLMAHAWTVGYRGDLAFSALIVGGDSSKRTNVVLQKFLTAVK